MEELKIIHLKNKVYNHKYLASKKKNGISAFLTHLIKYYNRKYKKYDIKKGHARYIPKKGYVFSKKGRGAFSIYYVSATRYDNSKELHELKGEYSINVGSEEIQVEDEALAIKKQLDKSKLMIPKVKGKRPSFIKTKIR